MCIVDWVDAAIDTDDFKKKDKHEFCRRSTVGYFVCETKDGVVLATDKYAKKSEGFAARMTIPWGMIENYLEFEVDG